MKKNSEKNSEKNNKKNSKKNSEKICLYYIACPVLKQTFKHQLRKCQKMAYVHPATMTLTYLNQYTKYNMLTCIDG